MHFRIFIFNNFLQIIICVGSKMMMTFNFYYFPLRPIRGTRSHKSRAAVDYTLIGVEPHRPNRGVWPIATVANDSQSHLVASSI